MASSKIPFRRRLSVRQAQIAVFIALAIGAVFAIMQILLDARDERKDLSVHAKSILDYAGQPAARAAYRLDDIGAQELVASLLSDPALVKAEILDETGLTLARAFRSPTKPPSILEQLLLGSDAELFARDLRNEQANIDVGTLIIELDPVAAAPGFQQRTWNALVSGLLKSTLLAFLLTMIFQLIITKRVTRLAESFARAARHQPGTVARGDELDMLENRVLQSTNALAKAVIEAEAANKAKSVFLASMSHEMRTPLNAIIGYAEALEMGIGADNTERRNSYLKNISSAGKQLNRLLGDILDFSKIEAGSIEFEIEDVSLADIIRSDIQQLEEIAGERQISLKTDIQSEATVQADQSRLRQILLNFVTNATKYNASGGMITVGVTTRPDGRQRLFVEDSGSGIPPDQLQSIFEPFVRGDNNLPDIPGAGLGLAICKMLAEGMGGRIGCDSVLAKGSTFWVDLKTSDSGELSQGDSTPQLTEAL
ncbi:sensor histidine kinase [Nisaea denitrificans]|uniref:sensor histidine kinase n=1 Tax=Nisaea denitrificans TaxID=390877 RepID=UPI000569DD07|nr:HAMP domain-containing sensor histidine kinase [Nisaea denitrificans]